MKKVREGPTSFHTQLCDIRPQYSSSFDGLESAVCLRPLLRTADHTCSKPAIFRLHRHTTYVGAVYCYRLSSVVCHSSEPAKTAEPIEMPFGLRTPVGPRNHALDRVQIPPWEGAILRGKEWPIVKHKDTLR